MPRETLSRVSERKPHSGAAQIHLDAALLRPRDRGFDEPCGNKASGEDADNRHNAPKSRHVSSLVFDHDLDEESRIICARLLDRLGKLGRHEEQQRGSWVGCVPVDRTLRPGRPNGCCLPTSRQGVLGGKDLAQARTS